MKKLLVLPLLLCSVACSEAPEKVNLVTGTKDDPTVVSPQNCPDWTKRSGGSNYYNTTHSNFRCATITNYGAMVADPNDMIEGKSSNYGNGARAAAAVSAYEAGTASADSSSSGSSDSGSSGSSEQ